MSSSVAFVVWSAVILDGGGDSGGGNGGDGSGSGRGCERSGIDSGRGGRLTGRWPHLRSFARADSGNELPQAEAARRLVSRGQPLLLPPANIGGEAHAPRALREAAPHLYIPTAQKLCLYPVVVVAAARS